MAANSKVRPADISKELKDGFKKVRKILIEKEKQINGYLIISDKNGNIKKVAARDL